jgi:hypothetical protein
MVIIIIDCHKKVSQWDSFPRKATVVASEVFHRQQKKIHWEIKQEFGAKGGARRIIAVDLEIIQENQMCQTKSTANLRDDHL